MVDLVRNFISITAIIIVTVKCSTSNKDAFLDEMRTCYLRMITSLTKEQQNDLHSFMMIFSEQNSVKLGDPSYSLVEASKSNSFPKAIIKYLRQKFGLQYIIEIAKRKNRVKLSYDYNRLLLQPCKAFIDIWSSSVSLFMLRRYQRDVVEMVESEREMYNALITGQVCFYLLELTDAIFEKSYRYIIKQKSSTEAWFARLFGKNIGSELSRGES